MSRKTRTTLGVVEKLIEQRRLFQDWMDKLAAGSVDGMPAHVIERVRNDYRERLTGVMAELGEHREALNEALEEAQEREDGLEAQQQERKDELAELRLRRHVGEMDEGRFKEQSGTLQTTLDSLKKDLASALRDIERYEEILEMIASGDAREDEPETDTDEEAVLAEIRNPEPAPAARAPEPPRTERKSSPDLRAPKTDLDELAFLRSVTTGGAIKPVPGAAPAAAAASARPASPVPATSAPVLTSIPAAPAPAPQSSATATAVSAPPQPKVAAEEAPVNFDAAPSLVRLPELEPEPVKEAPPARASLAPKKEENAGLTCKECGTLNRPTEWYCEKCGAELAAF
ncbi:MAG TPA: hypothetical protein VGI92_14475 [Gemmatimonadales bacterium]|jgi:hypothetical protein